MMRRHHLPRPYWSCTPQSVSCIRIIHLPDNRKLHQTSARWNADDQRNRSAENVLGNIKKDWRPLVHFFDKIPLIQRTLEVVATYLTPSSELDFFFARTFHEKFLLGDILGSGSYGQVYTVEAVVPPKVSLAPDDHLKLMKITNEAARHSKKSNESLLAVKVIPKSKISNHRDYVMMKQEAEILYLLSGTVNVVHFFGAYEDNDYIYFVLEHCLGGNANELVHKYSNRVVSEAVMAHLMYNILYAVHQCHANGVVHTDIKLDNFLIANDDAGEHLEKALLKLTDFGGAIKMSSCKQELSQMCGSPLYSSPEMLRGSYSYQTDIWSCGVIMYKLFTRDYPFPQDQLLNERILLEEIDFSKGALSEASVEAIDLLKQLLDRNIHGRITALDAVHHAWFDLVRLKIQKTSH